jgi:16S rRNA (cytosine1407-C5)-methyltransferase
MAEEKTRYPDLENKTEKEENDGVAGRLLEKYGVDTVKAAGAPGVALLDPPDFTEGEATRYGRLILPDTSGGMGPMYVARFRRG